MKRWEYDYVLFEPTSVMTVLDEAGREGWEAYAVTQSLDPDDRTLITTYYLRRPLPETP